MNILLDQNKVREHTRGNREWKIQRYRQHRAHKAQE